MPQIVFTPGNIFEVRSVTSGPQNIARKAIYYNNEPAYLAGIFANTKKLDGTNGEGGFQDYQFTYIMDRHFRARNNFFRHYIINYFLYDHTKPENRTPTGEDPRKRYSPFLWLPAQQKWDLTKYNDDYFGRLRAMVAAAREGIIYVQITLFDCAGMRFGDRWPLNPWNADRNINGVIDRDENAGPDFYNRDLPARDSAGKPTTLGVIQDAYINKVLSSVMEYGNVMFEIMNEPTGGSSEARAVWADAIVGTINGTTKGRRLIFYNDHSQSDSHPEGGRDVIKWKDLNLANYHALDGVIIHGKIYDDTSASQEINPDTRNTWTFRADKVIQGSTDTVDEALREKKNFNTNTTNTCFQRLMLYQAEAVSDTALAGIYAASPQPSFITPFRALGVWDKTSTAGPHFNVRFEANGRYTAFNCLTNQIMTQGRLIDFDPDYFTVLPDGQTTSTEFIYGATAQRLFYRTPGEGAVIQEFDRFPVDFEPFVFGWEKIGENPVSARPRYFLYFKKKGPALSFAARDPQSQSIFNEGTVTAISSFPPRITLLSTSSGETVFSYSFTNNGKNLTLTSSNRVQEFKRFI